MSMAAPVVASQYAVPFTPVAPVRPVAPMLPVTPMPVTTMPAHSAQPWMYAPVPVQCEMEGSETLGEAWLRSRSHPHPHAHGHSKEKRQLGSSSSGSTTG
ncbi:hypothetical protein CspeluHIS016_0306010 [Cutaneotrichosporon spelunceum]|uniref:Uncharacterized protein n=1 Tax=Cutaneotrichosporon spelunceum TaxID=1672016 RepID=A0AAD3TUI8_9TREE|nr:hypothetical protein CspeluHIS016_0306010 [Cutaneotrichosporon spelunceum]